MTSSNEQSPRPIGRRGFLATLGALAATGAEGCRRAVSKIVPYASMPEKVVPGVPAHYATVYVCGSDAVGLVVESHEGRPTKIEGNPLHPSSLGAADLITQASILDLYDADRATQPTQNGAPVAWESVDAAVQSKLAELAKNGGAGLRLLMQPSASPTIVRLLDAVLTRFPRAQVHAWASVDDASAREGAKLAYGAPVRALHDYDRARVVLSLDADFLQTESGAVRAQKLFAQGRKLESSKDGMNRLYVVEPSPTTTGAHADHRLRLSRARIETYAMALAAELVKQGVSLGALDAVMARAPAMTDVPSTWLTAVARDLLKNRGKSIVVAGAGQPPTVHALVHAMNEALENVGATVRNVALRDDVLQRAASIGDLVAAMNAGTVDALFLFGGNPVYDAPADLAFADALTKVSFSLHLASFVDETAVHCSWSIPRAHAYEAWGDARALDGTIAVQQPLIDPLFGGRSELEVLATIAGSTEIDGHALVRATSEGQLLSARGLRACVAPQGGKIACVDATGAQTWISVLTLDHDARKVLRDGVHAGTAYAPSTAALRLDAIAAAISARPTPPSPSAQSLEAIFIPDAKMLDGRHANNVWLQELPDPLTKLVWDNAALLSKSTAAALGVTSGDVVELTRAGRSIRAAIWVQPGVADGCVVLPLGWGRTRAGRIGNQRGFDVQPLRTTDALHFAPGVTLTPKGEKYAFATTQHHDSTEDRPLLREATYDEYAKHPHFAELQSPPKRSLPLWQDQDYSKGHQWGMSIDLNACTGCNACVVACQAENNVSVVGKEQVAAGREMHWLRIDRYFTGDHGSTDDCTTSFQPLACVQCEEAPCENVCPVAATMHSGEGLSEVVYNRCIGTRYCANNCPYKVRRFNYLDWHGDGVWKGLGGFPETLQMQRNPNVTVRTRGVIEKCSYCVQRIEGRRHVAAREGRELVDGEIVTACQQTCPSNAIVFGDLNDDESRVSKATMQDRRYAMLEELGVKPRTTYLAKVRNPNPEMA